MVCNVVATIYHTEMPIYPNAMLVYKPQTFLHADDLSSMKSGKLLYVNVEFLKNVIYIYINGTHSDTPIIHMF